MSTATPGTETAEIVIACRSALTIEFKIRRPSAVPSKAVLMIKRNLSDADNLALVAKSIYPAASSSGVIASPTGTSPVLRFLISELDSAALTVGDKLFTALKVWPTGGAPYSPPGGRRGVRVVAEGVFQTT
jgi:hypothetical protein